MALTLQYSVVTPERIVEEGEATSISIMTSMGEVTILPHHVPLLALMQAGELRIRNGKADGLLAVSTGMVEVRQDGTVVILADTAERSDELELATIEAAKERAALALKDMRNRNDVAYADAAAHLERELARYKVARKKGRGGRTSMHTS